MRANELKLSNNEERKMANKKESNGNGTSIVSMFEQVAETGFGEVQAEDLRTPRISIIQGVVSTKEERQL